MKRFFYSHLFFKKLEWVVIGASLFSILFHLFGLSQAMLFNEDIWLRKHFSFTNFWTTFDPMHYAPLSNFIQILTNEFLPLWGTWSHLQMMILYVIFIGLCLRFFKKKLELPPWLTWLGIGLLTSFPLITEGTFWIFGSHAFHSVIWFLVALNLFPEEDQQTQWWRWLAPGTALLLMLSSSPVTYPSYFLLILYFAIRFCKTPRIMLVWGAYFLLGVCYIYFRNLVLYQDGWTFLSPTKIHYGFADQSFFVDYLESLVEALEYSNPVIILQRYLFEGHLSESPRNLLSLLHLVWLLPVWGMILLRRSSMTWEVFIYGVGATGVILVTDSPHPTRYMIPLIFVQTTGLLLFFQHWIHPLQIFRKLVILVIGLCLLGSNLLIKTKVEWFQWMVPQQIEQSVLDIAAQSKEDDPPLVFLSHKIWKKMRDDNFHYTGGDSASLGELRKVLEYAEMPRCIYQGYNEEAGSAEIEMVHNENDNVFHSWNSLNYQCPAVLKTMQPVLCYQYDDARWLFGEFKRISGVVTVPGSIGIDPNNWQKHDQTFDIKVDCI